MGDDGHPSLMKGFLVINCYIRLTVGYSKEVKCKKTKGSSGDDVLHEPDIDFDDPLYQVKMPLLLTGVKNEKQGKGIICKSLNRLKDKLFKRKNVIDVFDEDGFTHVYVCSPLPRELSDAIEQCGYETLGLYEQYDYSIGVENWNPDGEAKDQFRFWGLDKEGDHKARLKRELLSKTKDEAITTAEHWKNKVCDRRVIYQPQDKPQPGLDFCRYLSQCITYELITTWKKYCPPDLEKDTADTTESAESTDSLLGKVQQQIKDLSDDIKTTAGGCCRIDEKHPIQDCHFEMEALRDRRLPNGLKLRNKDEWMLVNDLAKKNKLTLDELNSLRDRGEKTRDKLFGCDQLSNIWAKRTLYAKQIFYYIGCESPQNVTTEKPQHHESPQNAFL